MILSPTLFSFLFFFPWLNSNALNESDTHALFLIFQRAPREDGSFPPRQRLLSMIDYEEEAVERGVEGEDEQEG